MEIDLIAGARPNFVKIAALIHANREAGNPIEFRLIHTGQHYDRGLSENFFQDLRLPEPDINFGIGSGSQAVQTAGVLMAYEKLLQVKKPEICIVVGDVNSSMACAITAKKMQVKIAHVEAGIRSGDWSMPEEINRIVIDSIADYFFTTSRQASDSLLRSGHSRDRIFFVGNTMIDTLMRFRAKFRQPEIWDKVGLKNDQFLVLTLHRPGNVDEGKKLVTILQEVIKNSKDLALIFPVHPRTAKALKDYIPDAENLYMIQPLDYLEFNYLLLNAKAVITDSGGITEEATVLGVPCMTIRNNTERPETVEMGTNEVIGTNPENIAPALKKLFSNEWKKGKIPQLWDGRAGERIIKELLNLSKDV